MRIGMALRSFFSGWGRSYAVALASGRLRFPALPADEGPRHFILLVANHFEPLWNGRSLGEGRAILRRWCDAVVALGAKDGDGHPFKHTYFYPAEQYHPDLLEPLVEHCADGFGEVEVHLHHGTEAPDTADNLERTLLDFVARLGEHGCLACDRRTGATGYCFVHGDWALANSWAGQACGVDNELEILARTGCYLDCTMPSAPHPSQVPVINAIYQCGRPLAERAPHRTGSRLARGERALTLPVLLEGPLLLDWSRRLGGMPVPRIEDGGLRAEAPPSLARFRRWASANVHVVGAPAWVFVKLHTHGLIERHREALLGDPMKRFLEELLATYDDGPRSRVHFATAREAANMIFAAVDGLDGDPGRYRDYRYLPRQADEGR